MLHVVVESVNQCYSTYKSLHRGLAVVQFSILFVIFMLATIYSSGLFNCYDAPLFCWPHLSLEILLGCFCSLHYGIIHLHCEAQSNQFCSIWLNLTREYSPVHPAASISRHTINKQPDTGLLAAIHAHAISLPPPHLTVDVVCFRS